jgi:uncharacterized protein YbcI
MPALQAVGPARVRRRGQIEADISKAMIRFERERMGKGPADIRTRIVDDLVIVRMSGSLTPAERALIHAGEVDLLRQVRLKLLDCERQHLTDLLRDVTGGEVASVYSDLSVRTGERLIVFVMERALEWRDPTASW